MGPTMSNDERVQRLNKELDITLHYSGKIGNEKSSKPNKTKLKKLADKIRKTLEETSVDPTAHPHTGIRP